MMGVIAGMVLAIVFWWFYRQHQRTKLVARQDAIRRFVFDASVSHRLTAKYPHLTPAQVQQVLEGLRDYFYLSLGVKGMLSMPSQAVDEAWHAFILSTRAYAGFCQRAFGRFLHHHPAETMTTATQATQGIRRIWNLACRREGINAARPERLPRLFALDRELNIPNGFYYSPNCMAMAAAGYCASHIGNGCGGGCSSSGGGCSSSSSESNTGSDSSSDGSGSDSSGCGGGCGGGGD